ncbi:hypothetical protein [Bacteroides sp.]|uniref:hypothetical protein n=1 Tax=Bacteroides sp. TaxID=29523 RepID=UPI0025C2BDBC|nr:hypothetical protein [Bacteroides sp.]
MKTKIYLGILSLVMGLTLGLASCSDDDYAINATPLLTDSSVVTGSADVTATSATLHGTVSGLKSQASSAYVTGFNYGEATDMLTERIVATGGDEFSATVAGSVNQTIYYQAYVTLQGKVTYKGEVKSLVLTNARAVTGDATQIGANKATLAGSLADFPTDAESGILVSGVAGTENVRAGVRIATNPKGSYTVNVEGLLPNTTYYYVAYLDLGAGVVYGEEKSFTTTNDHVFDLDNDLVDLGLSTKWAKYNVGATSETEIGGLFGFGDMIGFNTSIDPANFASADIYKTANDLVFNVFEGKATMPTIAEFEELFALCTREWTEVEGVAGYKFTGPNGNSIFMPAAGSRTQAAVTGAGAEGYYLSGSINVSDNQFAMSYHFTNAIATRATTPVYQALAVRAVSTAKNVPFDRSLLYGKWYIDNGQDGEQHVFEGPFTQWGKTYNWAIVSNGQPFLEDPVHWEMGVDNGWIGYTYGVDYGYMEFFEDGTVNIHRLTDDGVATDETGKYTIDEENKVIDIDINVLCANTWVAVKSGKLNILSLTSDGLQIALLNNDNYAYSVNYYSQRKAEADTKIPVSLLCASSDGGGTWGADAGRLSPAELAGQHTFTYEGSCSDAMVFALDFQGLMGKYPNTFVRIDEMKCDGNAIKFNANNFFYGDIEGNGNYRVELFNIYGKGAASGKVLNSAFSNSQNIGSEPAVHFNNSLEVTYTVFTDGNGAGTYMPTVNMAYDWGDNQVWSYNQGATFEVKYENFQYSIVGGQFDIKYQLEEGKDFSNGTMMTFIEVVDLYGFFPDTHATLDNLYLDGSEITFDATKVLDANEGPKYRLELWNCYGATKTGGCAFGVPDGDIIKELGFGSSMEVKFTFHNLFTVPQW